MVTTSLHLFFTEEEIGAYVNYSLTNQSNRRNIQILNYFEAWHFFVHRQFLIAGQ